MSDTTDLVARLSGMSADHGPDGWPAVRMRDITALCNEVTRLRADFAALRHALVGDAGASAIETAHRLRAAPAQAGASAAPQWECKAGGLKPLTDAQYQVQPPNIQRHYTRIAPAQREPLSDAQIEELREDTFSTSNPFCPCDSKTMRKAVRAAERAHGITASGAQEQR